MKAATISATPEPAAVAAALGPWYAAHGRHQLPWRLTRDPYAVLVSEVMLQQTQVGRVLPYYEACLARWPTIDALAAADVADVIRAWAGLGYNRRAVYLHRLSRAVREQHAGQVPSNPDALRRLPGIGPYTAAAVASFAFGEGVAVVDTNVGRVITRLVGGKASHREVAPKWVATVATALLPGSDARAHNLALMDIGATICLARAPECPACPLQHACAWRAAGYPASAASPPPPAERFEQSARFARGRIVEALRGRAAETESGIAAVLPVHHVGRIGEYLAALERDGLIQARGAGTWALAGGNQGSSSMASPKL